MAYQEMESWGFKILWSLTPVVVAIIGFFIRKSLGRTVKDIDKLIAADDKLHDDNEKLHNRITELLGQLQHLQGQHDAIHSFPNERRMKPR